MAPLNIAILVGSTRPGRNGAPVAAWVHERASERKAAIHEVVDLEGIGLPLLDEAVPALAGRYEHQYTQDGAGTIARFDGFVFVTPEYNHSTSPALLNALDYLYSEWNNKAVGFVSYGTSYGVRAVEHLRGVVGEAHDGVTDRVAQQDKSAGVVPYPPRVDSLLRVVDEVEEFLCGFGDVVVIILGGATLKRDDAPSANIAEVPVRKAVATFRFFRFLGVDAQMPLGVFAPAMLLDERVLIVG